MSMLHTDSRTLVTNLSCSLGLEKITITSEDNLDEDRDLTEHEAGSELPQEHKPRSTVIAEILSHGYVLGDQAAQKSLEFDNNTGISATFKNFLSTVQKKTTELDQQFHVSDKVKEVDGKYKVSETTTSTTKGIQDSVTSFFSQVAAHPLAQKATSYLSAPLGSVADIHNEARRMANVRQGGTEEHAPGSIIHESNSTSTETSAPAAQAPQTSGVSATEVPKLGSTI